MKKVKIDRELFVERFSKLMKFVPAKSIVPAFENAMIKVTGDKMTITVSDGSVQCKSTLACKSGEDFTICVPAKLFFKTISLFRENEVIIKQKSDKKIELQSGKSKYNIALDCDENGFPVMRLGSTENEIVLRQMMLKIALKSSQKFVDDENTNANYTAINIREVDNRIVTTGIMRGLLCRVSVSPISINKWEQINIPTDTSSKVCSMLSDIGEVTVIHNQDKACFVTGSDIHENFEIMSVLANIKFPDTEALFNKCPEPQIEANTIELSDSIKRLKLYCEPGKAPSFKLLVNDVDMTLESSDKTTDRDGEEFVSVLNNTASGVSKMFNNDYFIQILNSVDSNDVIIKFSDSPNKPCFVFPKQATDDQGMFSFCVSEQTI